MATDDLFHVRTGRYVNDSDLIDILAEVCPLYGWTISEYTQGTSLTLTNGEIVYSFIMVDCLFNSNVKLLAYKATTVDGNLISDYQNPNYFNAGYVKEFYTLKKYILAVNSYNICLNYYIYFNGYFDSNHYLSLECALGVNLLKYNTFYDTDVFYAGNMGYIYSSSIPYGYVFAYQNSLGFLCDSCNYVSYWGQTPYVKRGNFVYFNSRIFIQNDILNYIKTSNKKMSSCIIEFYDFADSIGEYISYTNVINKLTYSFSTIKQKQIVFIVNYDYLGDGNLYTFPIGYSPTFGVDMNGFNGVVELGTEKYFIFNATKLNVSSPTYFIISRDYGVGYKIYDYLEANYD